ncbi:nucleoid-associated protein YgaU [Arcanobacterium wilhelmae]|uniref:Nucleoid-associated protein YgaU n=1 Tax=Arcanobacterium wilhelmae TaxID=1803177 RepID=A0ABT9NBD7_9ACTO|nr:LysM peptidoglycan-binding domain-containing protein [Arcanobacterium wilhelmae]MDP9800541.1 nucleoid-associated protein YgaU [Arcanobacterium wilhelmae]WFN89958.1 LysM peptidoglycan-binding domain-containing protein [Arcanobacterium wilhelmae]
MLWHTSAWVLYTIANRTRNASLMAQVAVIAPKRIARKAALALTLPTFMLASPAVAAPIDLTWGSDVGQEISYDQPSGVENGTPDVDPSSAPDARISPDADSTPHTTATPDVSIQPVIPTPAPASVALPHHTDPQTTVTDAAPEELTSPRPQTTPSNSHPRTPANITTSAPRKITVHRGDSLWAIAQKIDQHQTAELVDRIWHHNKSVIGDNPNLIYAGQVLEIPEVTNVSAR